MVSTKKTDTLVMGLIGAVIVLFLITALAPEVFANIFAMDTTNGTPAWFKVVITVVTGAGFIFLVWRAVNQ